MFEKKSFDEFQCIFCGKEIKENNFYTTTVDEGKYYMCQNCSKEKHTLEEFLKSIYKV